MNEKQRLTEESERNRLEIIAKQQERKMWEDREQYLARERQDILRKQRERERECEREREHERAKEMLEETQSKSSWINKMSEASGPSDSQSRANHKVRESWLTEELSKINEEEADALRNTIAQDDSAQQYEHFVRFPQEEDFDLTEEIIEDQASILFENAPIKFRPRKGRKIDYEIQNLIDQLHVTIPIIWVKNSLYVIGSTRINLVKRGENIMAMAKVAGGCEKFEEYLNMNHRSHEVQLVHLMVKSCESLEWVLDSIKNGEKIKPDRCSLIDGGSTAQQQNEQPIQFGCFVVKSVSKRLNPSGQFAHSTTQSNKVKTYLVSGDQTPRHRHNPSLNTTSNQNKSPEQDSVYHRLYNNSPSKVKTARSPNTVTYTNSPCLTMEHSMQKQRSPRRFTNLYSNTASGNNSYYDSQEMIFESPKQAEIEQTYTQSLRSARRTPGHSEKEHSYIQPYRSARDTPTKEARGQAHGQSFKSIKQVSPSPRTARESVNSKKSTLIASARQQTRRVHPQTIFKDIALTFGDSTPKCIQRQKESLAARGKAKRLQFNSTIKTINF